MLGFSFHKYLEMHIVLKLSKMPGFSQFNRGKYEKS